MVQRESSFRKNQKYFPIQSLEFWPKGGALRGSSVTSLHVMGLENQVSIGIPKPNPGDGGGIGGNFQTLPLSFWVALWTQA